MSLTQRDRLLAYLRESGLSTARAEANLDAFAHELAEQIRQDAQSRHDRDFSDNRIFRLRGAQAAADLIDARRGAGSVRPDEEPT